MTSLVQRVLCQGAALLVTVVACHGETDEARRAEAGRIAEAVRQVRAAPNDDKRPLLRSLRDLGCSAKDLCELKQRCADAYELELMAFDGIAAVRRAVRGKDPIPPEASDLLAKSEANLKRAAELTRACADSEGATRRRYSL